MRDLYTEITNKILAELASGTVPWVKPWSSFGSNGMPVNASTGRPYSGVNVVLLWCAAQDAGWRRLRFLTFKQAKEAGGTVRMGEHGTHIIFLKKLLVKDKSPNADAEDKKTIPMMREYTVFNVDQCDGLPEKIVNGATLRVRNPDTRDELADDFVAATGAVIRDGGEAYFVPSKDFISMPKFEAFKGADHFYGTSFHELTHWTGHETRLNRDLKNARGTKDYAAEELVAELGSAFMCAEFGFDAQLINPAGYIAHWIKLLQDDKKAFISAASKASKAVEFLRGKVLTEEFAEAA